MLIFKLSTLSVFIQFILSFIDAKISIADLIHHCLWPVFLRKEPVFHLYWILDGGIYITRPLTLTPSVGLYSFFLLSYSGPHVQGVQEKLCFFPQFTATPPSPTSL